MGTLTEKRRWQRYDRSLPASVWEAIDDLREAIDEMVTADEVASAVSETLKRERLMAVGWAGKLVGLVIAVASLATAAHSWFG